MDNGSKYPQTFIEKIAKIAANTKMPNLRYRSLSHLIDILFDGVFIKRSVTSKVVPNGQIQLQKNLPIKGVNSIMTNPGQNNHLKLNPSRNSNKGISGLNRSIKSDSIPTS
jgi:hypothetical protein